MLYNKPAFGSEGCVNVWNKPRLSLHEGATVGCLPIWFERSGTVGEKHL